MNIHFKSIVIIIIINIIFNTSSLVFAQGESNIWYFGTKAGLNFNGGGAPTLLNNGAINSSGIEGEGCSAISDGSGNLLFYTDGVTIYNRNHVAMTNGTGLTGDRSSTQTAIIAPRPGSTTEYYVFTSPVTNGTNQIRYNIVDMTLSTGLGAVTATKNVVMPSCAPMMMEALTSVPTNVPGEYWLIGHRAANAGSNNSTSDFYAWRVTASGISAPVISSAGYALPSHEQWPGTWVSQGQGFLKSNTCYTKIFASYFAQGSAGRVDMLNFNKSTGVVSGPSTIINNFINNFEIYSIEISPNDRFLYVTELGQSGTNDEKLHQFDLNAGSQALINASRYTLMTSAPGTFVRTGHLQLAPDGKIYVSHHSFAGTMGQLGVINNPDVLGAGANYQNAPASLTYPAGTGTHHGLPQFPRNFVAGSLRINGATTICAGATPNVVIPLSYTFSGSVSSVVWSTNGGGTFSPNNTSHAPSVTYTTVGTKKVVLTLTDICSNIYKDSIEIEILPEVNTVGTITCDSPIEGNVTSPDPSYQYVWAANSDGTNILGIGTAGVPLTVPGETGTVYLRAVSSASALPPSTNTLRNTGTMNTWGASGNVTVNFTVNSTIRLNSFEWGNGTIPGWPNPATTYTVSIQDATGATTYYTTSHTTADGSSAYNKWIETGLNLTLTAGNYRFSFSHVPQTWSAGTNNSDANVNITTNAARIGNFNYTVQNYIVNTEVACAQIAAVPYNCPLPVTWLGFEATRQGSEVKLEWVTSYEENSKGFYIQRSSDGINFETIGYVTAAGNSSTMMSYEYLDQTAPSSAVYYRLMEEDLDGTTMVSPVKLVKGYGILDLKLVPNPGNGYFKIIGATPQTPLTVTIFSVTGQSVYTTSVFPGETVDMSQFAKGYYVVQILTGDAAQTTGFINQ